MYTKIVNPFTNRRVDINSKLGKKILHNYLVISSGGAVTEGDSGSSRCTQFRKNIEPKCGEGESSHCQWYKGIGCYPKKENPHKIRNTNRSRKRLMNDMFSKREAVRTRLELINTGEQDSINQIYDNQIDICSTKFSERNKRGSSWKRIEDADRECGICPYTNAGEQNLIDIDRTTCSKIGDLCYSDDCGADKTLFLKDKSKIVLEDNIYIIPPDGEVCFGDTITECIAITLVFEGNYKIAAHINPTDFIATMTENSGKNTKINCHNLLYWIKRKIRELTDIQGQRPILQKILIFSGNSSDITIFPLEKKQADGSINNYWIFAPDDFIGNIISNPKNLNFNSNIHREELIFTEELEFGQNTMDLSGFAMDLSTILNLNIVKNIDIQFKRGTVIGGLGAVPRGVIIKGTKVAPCLLIAADGTWNI
uniref:Uncharacterized protein n=1 Tax=viral metagenome TaxID=1070528 RepID=A0A6C0IXP3_9ZZZZ